MNDEFLEDYFMLFGWHKDRIFSEVPVFHVVEQTTTTADTNKGFTCFTI